MRRAVKRSKQTRGFRSAVLDARMHWILCHATSYV
jgi:hypothetical protein